MGSDDDGALTMNCVAVAASTVLVVFVIAAFVGITIGLEGYQGLQIIGLAPLAGYLSSYANTREIAPLITAFGLAAQMGCKFTTQIGAMRISEEIDALEVIGVRSLPYLVTSRLVAALVVVTPLYLIALSGDTASFLAGGEIPVPAVQANAGSAPTIGIEYKPFGVQLTFMPTVLANGVINLRLAPSVSECSRNSPDGMMCRMVTPFTSR